MIDGLIGVKIGMTRHFAEGGIAIPVTVIKIEPHKVSQVKTLKKHGYCALQVTPYIKKLKRINKAEKGHFEKSQIDIGNGLWEFRFDSKKENVFDVGKMITISLFENIKTVDITGISKGKGFSGTVKRWNFRSQDASHGNSLSHRAPGSIGQNQTPGRVFKGKKMAGQLGNVRVTVQNLDIVSINLENNLLLIKGSVPGEINDLVRVRISKKIKKIV